MIRVLSIVEGTYITGPIRPLLMFAAYANRQHPSRETLRLLTTARGEVPNELAIAAKDEGVLIDTIRERGRFDLNVAREYAARVAQLRPDVVETHDTKCHFLLYLAQKFFGLRRDFKWIAVHHGYTKTSNAVRAYQLLDRLTLRAADRVLTVCVPFLQQVTDKGVPTGRVELIRNPAPQLKRLSPDNAESHKSALGIRPDVRVLVAVGRLSKEKGHVHLIRAVARLPSESGAVIVCVGDGPERPHLAAEALRLGVSVVFAGQQKDVVPFLSMADVFVQPSLSEGAPLALLEAMSVGCPIVATEVGGVPEILTNEYSALLVPPEDPDALARAIQRVIVDPAMAARISKAAAAEAAGRSIQNYADSMDAIYARLLSGQHA